MLFKNLIVVLEFPTSLSFKEKQLWKKKITENGGTLSYIVTKKVTFVITFDGQPFSYKIKKAKNNAIPVLRSQFVEDCILQQSVLPWDKYVASDEEEKINFQKGTIAVKKKPAKKVSEAVQLLASNCWTFLDPNCPFPKESDAELVKWTILKNGLDIHVIEIHIWSTTSEKKFRLFHQSGTIDNDKNILKKDDGIVWLFSTPDEALGGYEQLYRRYTSKPYYMCVWEKPLFQSNQLGTDHFKKVLSELCLLSSSVAGEVKQFVELVWFEAISEATSMLVNKLEHIKLPKLEEAEAALAQLKASLKTGCDSNRQRELVEKFFAALPHKPQFCQTDLALKEVVLKQDLCQLIHDIQGVSEAIDWSDQAASIAKFRALHCHISYVSKENMEFQQITGLLKEASHKIVVNNLYKVDRTLEDIAFNRSVGNNTFLLHGSPAFNFLGILSRGLVHPNVVESEVGVNRTDFGLLGSGLYFTDSPEKALMYATPGLKTQRRFILISEVALGKIYKTTNIAPAMTEPPLGFHSVLGVAASEGDNSSFLNNEYVVYHTSQYRMRYVCEVQLQDDVPMEDISLRTIEENETSDDLMEISQSIDIQDIQDIADPLNKVKPGLIASGKSLPLKSVHIRAKLLDLVSQVVVLQKYRNESCNMAEAKYVFPLESSSAVCGFEAFINNKHIIGVVKEKAQAQKEYKEAVSKGHGAYLMEEEEPDVFTVSVGNLPPDCDVLIKITYVSELKVEGEHIVFSIPTNIAPWIKDSALSQQTQSTVKTMAIGNANAADVTLEVAVEMPFDIRNIYSPTHKVKMKKTASKAVVKLPKRASLVDGFLLYVTLAEIHVPRMWVEKHPSKKSQACMVAFYPEFETEDVLQQEFIFLLDLSNSMKGQSVRDAKKILCLAIDKISEDSHVNVISFGTSFVELFPVAQRKTNDVSNQVTKFLESQDAILGGSNVVPVMNSLAVLYPRNRTRNIFLFSDGHLGNADLLMTTVQACAKSNRVFCLGVGPNVNSHLLQDIAFRGGGTYQYYNNKTKSVWETRLKDQLLKASQPSISEVRVKWEQHSDNLPAPIQAPSLITNMFSGSRLVVYALADNCTQAELCAKLDGTDISTMVSTTELNITEGMVVHQLTAKSVIDDYENGVLSQDRVQHVILKQIRKRYIVELSIEYSIVTPYTSFVAIEDRSKDGEDNALKTSMTIEQLVDKETVDILPYVGWEDSDAVDEKDPIENVEEILRQAAIAESFSQLEAERLYISILDYKNSLNELEEKDIIYKIIEEVQRFSRNAEADKCETLLYELNSLLLKDVVFVKTLSGKTERIAVDLDTCCIIDIQQKLYEANGVPLDQQRLIFGGQQLQVSRTATSYGIQNEAILFLVQRLRGGATPEPALFSVTKMAHSIYIQCRDCVPNIRPLDRGLPVQLAHTIYIQCRDCVPNIRPLVGGLPVQLAHTIYIQCRDCVPNIRPLDRGLPVQLAHTIYIQCRECVPNIRPLVGGLPLQLAHTIYIQCRECVPNIRPLVRGLPLQLAHSIYIQCRDCVPNIRSLDRGLPVQLAHSIYIQCRDCVPNIRSLDRGLPVQLDGDKEMESPLQTLDAESHGGSSSLDYDDSDDDGEEEEEEDTCASSNSSYECEDEPELFESLDILEPEIGDEVSLDASSDEGESERDLSAVSSSYSYSSPLLCKKKAKPSIEASMTIETSVAAAQPTIISDICVIEQEAEEEEEMGFGLFSDQDSPDDSVDDVDNVNWSHKEYSVTTRGVRSERGRGGRGGKERIGKRDKDHAEIVMAERKTKVSEKQAFDSGNALEHAIPHGPTGVYISSPNAKSMTLGLTGKNQSEQSKATGSLFGTFDSQFPQIQSKSAGVLSFGAVSSTGFGSTNSSSACPPTAPSTSSFFGAEQTHPQPAGGFSFGTASSTGFGSTNSSSACPPTAPSTSSFFGAAQTHPQPAGGFSFGTASSAGFRSTNSSSACPPTAPSTSSFFGAAQTNPQPAGGFSFGAARRSRKQKSVYPPTAPNTSSMFGAAQTHPQPSGAFYQVKSIGSSCFGSPSPAQQNVPKELGSPTRWSRKLHGLITEDSTPFSGQGHFFKTSGNQQIQNFTEGQNQARSACNLKEIKTNTPLCRSHSRSSSCKSRSRSRESKKLKSARRSRSRSLYVERRSHSTESRSRSRSGNDRSRSRSHKSRNRSGSLKSRRSQSIEGKSRSGSLHDRSKCRSRPQKCRSRSRFLKSRRSPSIEGRRRSRFLKNRRSPSIEGRSRSRSLKSRRSPSIEGRSRSRSLNSRRSPSIEGRSRSRSLNSRRSPSIEGRSRLRSLKNRKSPSILDRSISKSLKRRRSKSIEGRSKSRRLHDRSRSRSQETGSRADLFWNKNLSKSRQNWRNHQTSKEHVQRDHVQSFVKSGNSKMQDKRNLEKTKHISSKFNRENDIERKSAEKYKSLVHKLAIKHTDYSSQKHVMSGKFKKMICSKKNQNFGEEKMEVDLPNRGEKVCKFSLNDPQESKAWLSGCMVIYKKDAHPWSTVSKDLWNGFLNNANVFCKDSSMEVLVALVKTEDGWSYLDLTQDLSMLLGFSYIKLEQILTMYGLYSLGTKVANQGKRFFATFLGLASLFLHKHIEEFGDKIQLMDISQIRAVVDSNQVLFRIDYDNGGHWNFSMGLEFMKMFAWMQAHAPHCLPLCQHLEIAKRPQDFVGFLIHEIHGI